MTSPNIIFSINGQPQSIENQAVNLVDDRGLAYGHGLFETILFTESSIPLLERHLLRLIPDSHLLGIDIKSDDIRYYLDKFLESLACQSITSGVIKIIVTAGVGGQGYKMPDKIIPTLIFSYKQISENHNKQDIDIRLCSHFIASGSALAGVKHLNRLDQVIARSEWSHNRYADGLMLSETGNIIEATSANIFVKNKEGQWITPNLNQSGVSGVMRGLLMDEIFPACGLSVSVAVLNREELLSSQEIILCNSIRGIRIAHAVYSEKDELLMTLPSDQQSLMLRKKLIELYPQYQ